MAEDQIQEIKDRIEIVSLVGEYLPLKKAGRNYKALCPFHQEKTPSFMVSQELQIFKCFGCGVSGDHFAFLKQIEGMEFREALEHLADKAGVKLKRYQRSDKEERRERLLRLSHLTAEVYHHLLTTHKVGKRAYKYLKDRGISPESIGKFGLGYAPNSWDFTGSYLMSKKFTLGEIIDTGLAIPRDIGRGYYDRFRGRIIFPLRDIRGRVVGFAGRTLPPEAPSMKDQPKYINSPETELFSKSSFLYGLDVAKTEIRKQKRALVVEGLLDVITPYQAGIKNVVASQGTALTLGQLKLLQKLTDTLVFCYDTDRAGAEATKRGIALAQKQNLNLQVVLLPSGKDPDEAVREDLATFKKAVEEAVSINDFYFNSAFSKWDPTSALGKKRISQELIPIMVSIVDSVEQAHYIKRLSEGLGVSEKIIQEALSSYKKSPPVSEEGEAEFIKRFSKEPAVLEEYMLALLFRSSRDQNLVHKLAQTDFTGRRIELFTEFKSYILARKRSFDIKSFRAKLKNDLQDLAEKLYLWDLGRLEEEVEAFSSELETTYQLLKKGSIRRSLKTLSLKIKEAEKTGDGKKKKELAEKFQELAEKLR